MNDGLQRVAPGPFGLAHFALREHNGFCLGISSALAVSSAALRALFTLERRRRDSGLRLHCYRSPLSVPLSRQRKVSHFRWGRETRANRSGNIMIISIANCHRQEPSRDEKRVFKNSVFYTIAFLTFVLHFVF